VMRRGRTRAFVMFLVIGVIAGWLAGQILRGSGYGLVGDLVVGSSAR
jgi:uncharacterized membrane protein YeaQ/YmgE (transglycosylase-associated protein family)